MHRLARRTSTPRSLGAALAGAALLATGLAGAEPAPSGPAPAAPLLDRLPRVELAGPPPTQGPAHIPAAERVDGFYVEVPRHFAHVPVQAPRHVMVWGSPEIASALQSGSFQSAPASPCFMSAYPAGQDVMRWNGNLSTNVALHSFEGQGLGMPSSVQLVRRDEVRAERADGVTLSTTVAWIDARTRGARLVDRRELELALLRRMPGGVALYGGRTADQAFFLVRRAPHERERFLGSPIQVQSGAEHVASTGEACPVTFTLPIGAGTAATAIVQTEALLAVDPLEPDGGQGNGRGPLGVIFPRAAPTQGPTFGQHEARLRPLRVGVSVSALSQDTAPVLSISHGWSGRERIQPL